MYSLSAKSFSKCFCVKSLFIWGSRSSLFLGMSVHCIIPNRINYEQHVVLHCGYRIKTGNEFVTPILPIIRKILERNNIKMEITSNQKYKQFLKGIGLALGCSFPLTTHVAHHIFIYTIALGQRISKEVPQSWWAYFYKKITGIYAKLPMQYVSHRSTLGIRC